MSPLTTGFTFNNDITGSLQRKILRQVIIFTLHYTYIESLIVIIITNAYCTVILQNAISY